MTSANSGFFLLLPAQQAPSRLSAEAPCRQPLVEACSFGAWPGANKAQAYLCNVPLTSSRPPLFFLLPFHLFFPLFQVPDRR